jgi:hypothetical protein
VVLNDTDPPKTYETNTMNKLENLRASLTTEQARYAAMTETEEWLTASLAISKERIEYLEKLVALEQRSADIEDLLDSALQTLHPPQNRNGEASDDDGAISRTLGRRVYAWLEECMGNGIPTAQIDDLYDKLPKDMRTEFESVQSVNSPLFRFRRLIRKNKEAFTVDRASGKVSYLKAQKANAADNSSTEAKTRAPLTILINSKRIDTNGGRHFKYTVSNTPDKIREASESSFVAHLKQFPDDKVRVQLPDGSVYSVAVSKTKDGVERLTSYANQEWNLFLETGVATHSEPVKTEAA